MLPRALQDARGALKAGREHARIELERERAGTALVGALLWYRIHQQHLGCRVYSSPLQGSRRGGSDVNNRSEGWQIERARVGYVRNVGPLEVFSHSD